MLKLYTYRFTFGDGSTFKTPAPNYDKALDNLTGTYSESAMRARGGINIRIPKPSAPMLYSEDDIFTTADVCQIVGVAPTTLRHWTECGVVEQISKNKYNTKALRDALFCKAERDRDSFHYIQRAKKEKFRREVENV